MQLDNRNVFQESEEEKIQIVTSSSVERIPRNEVGRNSIDGFDQKLKGHQGKKLETIHEDNDNMLVNNRNSDWNLRQNEIASNQSMGDSQIKFLKKETP